MEQIILIGGGGHCKSIIDVIEQEKRFIIAGIVDRPELLGTDIFGYKVIGSDDDLSVLAKKYKNAIIAVGQIISADVRIKLFSLAKDFGFILPFVVSPRAYVSKYASIGEGTVVMHDAVINAGASIGKNCIINTKALVEHDSQIGDDCHISTGAIVNGGVIVEQGCFVGSNAVTRQSITIKKNSFIKAGSLVK